MCYKQTHTASRGSLKKPKQTGSPLQRVSITGTHQPAVYCTRAAGNSAPLAQTTLVDCEAVSEFKG